MPKQLKQFEPPQCVQTAVISRFSKSANRKAKDLYEKYLTVTAWHLKKVPDEKQKSLAKQLAYMEIQDNRFKRFFTNKKYWLEVENSLYEQFG
jgi:hypothetical protein